MPTHEAREVRVPIGGGVALEGILSVPSGARGVVIFAHGSGSSRHSARNRFVAKVLERRGLGTLLFDLLTEHEERIDALSGELRFDIPLLAERVVAAVDWIVTVPEAQGLRVGLFGASTGAAAALMAAAARPERVSAVVSRGGRPDLAGEVLPRVRAPVALIVGSRDTAVLELNRAAYKNLRRARATIEIVEGATHLFEEPGALERVADIAAAFFVRHLAPETISFIER